MAAGLTENQVHQVRERIRQVVERQLGTSGIAGTSMRSIASELGWTAAALYRYYGSKAELLAATRAAAYDRFSLMMEAAYASTSDLWARSRAIGDAYIEFAFAEPAAYQLIFAFEQDDREKTPELRESEARSRKAFLTYAADMVEAGLLNEDPELLAHVYWASLHGLIVLKMAGKLNASPPFEELRHAAVRLITRGATPLFAPSRSRAMSSPFIAASDGDESPDDSPASRVSRSRNS